MRIRFGLRTILAITLAACIVLGMEARRAENQRELAERLLSLDGTFERQPRWLMPSFVRSRVPVEYSETISEVNFGAMAAPKSTSAYFDYTRKYGRHIASTRTLREIAAVPAMRSVQVAFLFGTSVDDGLTEYVARLPSMNSVVVDGSTVTNEKYYVSQAQLLNLARRGRYPQEVNGPSVRGYFHADAMQLTSDLQLFARAYEEDAEAIRELLDLVPMKPESVNAYTTALMTTFREVKTQAAINVLGAALNDPEPSIRTVAVNFFALRNGVTELVDATDDPDLSVRTLAVNHLVDIPMDKVDDRE
ncbi:MAG: hypothetical protein AAF497_14070, partial [Planctomycetota bacterium]